MTREERFVRHVAQMNHKYVTQETFKKVIETAKSIQNNVSKKEV